LGRIPRLIASPLFPRVRGMALNMRPLWARRWSRTRCRRRDLRFRSHGVLRRADLTAVRWSGCSCRRPMRSGR
jgi:hypothetical protein